MENRSRVRRHKTPAEKAQILSTYARSTLSQREVAAQCGISLSTLQRWMHQGQVGKTTPRAGLVEVPNLFAAGRAASPYRLHFPRGLVLEVAPGFQPEQLRSLAQLIQDL